MKIIKIHVNCLIRQDSKIMIKSKINIIYYFIGIKDNKKKNYVIDKKYIFKMLYYNFSFFFIYLI